MAATVDKDPLLVAGTHGQGRTTAYTTDIGPHWRPPEFAEWGGYRKLRHGMVRWAAGET